ncbi:MAG TPA: hypothetical protein VMU27_01425, partial [Candidatus Paceibacterota bacterium]|nr:hypothetical protein [Candidatus Paceibacterota bacterium]
MKARALTFLIILATPAVAFAAPNTFKDLATTAAHILNYGAGALLTAAVAVYFWSIASGIYKINQGEASGGQLRSTILWGIIIIFFMVSIWGIIQFLQHDL